MYKVDIKCIQAPIQARSNIKRTQLYYNEARKGEAIETSDTEPQHAFSDEHMGVAIASVCT